VVGSRASGPCLVLRASPVVRVCYGIVLRRSWVGSVGWLRSWVVGVLEGLLRYRAS
jgi:hypothetical protein